MKPAFTRRDPDLQSDLQSDLRADEVFEYRVWGDHPAAEQTLIELAEGTPSQESLADCYLLVDDANWNVKVREDQLKLKLRSGATEGFERWSTQWCISDADTPAPFSSVIRQLDLGRAHEGAAFDLTAAVERLDDIARPVFVTKQRSSFQIGDVEAEIADLTIDAHESGLHSVSVKGEDLASLTELLQELGLDSYPNVAMHEMIDSVIDRAA